jgi:hypothetical protein
MLSVQYRRGQIAVQVDDRTLASAQDDTHPSGLIGLALFGSGRAVFHDLEVDEVPSPSIAAHPLLR